MTGVLTVVWFAAAIGGAVAVVVGVFTSGDRRRVSLIVAGGSFAVAGVLGVLSVGIIFLAFSVVCFVIAARTNRRSPMRSPMRSTGA